MDGGTSSAWRRLNAALFKLEQVLSSIDRISRANFPHGDSEEALVRIRSYFEEKCRIIRSLPRDEDAAVEDLQEYLREARDEVRRYTKYLGIILRSTNLRNNFEVYHPLKRLSQKAVSKDTRLIISSEWEFTPFTYPMNLPALPKFIIVGTPATESQNLLVLPLAGHEIGHSVWRSLPGLSRLSAELRAECSSFVEKNKSRFPGADERTIELMIVPRISTCLLAKSEEVFCDLVGLHMFGESYFFAFEYFLAPGINKSTVGYPPSIQRLRSLIAYADRFGIPYPGDIEKTWNQELESTTGEPTPFEIADEVLEACLEKIIAACQEIMSKRKISVPDVGVIKKVEEAFRRGEPYINEVKLSETINALWHVSKERDVTKSSDVEATFVDIEIALKTIEVAEYHSRLEEE